MPRGPSYEQKCVLRGRTSKAQWGKHLHDEHLGGTFRAHVWEHESKTWKSACALNKKASWPDWPAKAAAACALACVAINRFWPDWPALNRALVHHGIRQSSGPWRGGPSKLKYNMHNLSGLRHSADL